MHEQTEELFELTLEDFESLDTSMQRCLELARVAAKTDLPVLILGESGTGKTLLASAIHRSSSRKSEAFVSFNAAALSDSLLDSQLFGHERGAFTSAEKRVRGKFELADGGTLFLDEIANMTPAAQAKILRAVEYGEFERLGSEEIHRADVRVISATHLPIHDFMRTNQFRQDLFYRLNGISLTVPALRERPNDLPGLIAHEVEMAAAREAKSIQGFTRRALDRLCRYRWPGNLRELNRVVRTAVAMSETEVIEESCLYLQENPGAPASSSVNSPEMPETNVHELEGLSLQAAEATHILKILALMGGNKRQTARALGVSRSTLDRKLGELKPTAGSTASE